MLIFVSYTDILKDSISTYAGHQVCLLGLVYWVLKVKGLINDCIRFILERMSAVAGLGKFLCVRKSNENVYICRQSPADYELDDQ